MEQIKEVYDSVLKDSSEKLHDNKYDLGRLVNIRDKAPQKSSSREISKKLGIRRLSLMSKFLRRFRSRG